MITVYLWFKEIVSILGLAHWKQKKENQWFQLVFFCSQVWGIFLSSSRWPSWSAGGPGGGRANGTTCLPGGHGCVAPGAKRAASRHSLADTVGTHRHGSAEPTVTGASTQQVRVLPVPSTIIFCNTTSVTQVFNVAFFSSSACLSSCSSNLHSYARPVPRSTSPPGGHYSQRSRVGPHVYHHYPE